MARQPASYVTAIPEYTGLSFEDKKFLLDSAETEWETIQFKGKRKFDFYEPDFVEGHKRESRFVPVRDDCIILEGFGKYFTSRLTRDCLYVEDEAGLGVCHRWRV
jgi:hypothetical protein